MRVRRRKDGINYIEPEPIGICERCNRPVYWDDYILLDNGEMYHEDCYKEKDDAANALGMEKVVS